MPSGYTDALYKGEQQSFRDFALRCSRALGVAIMQRDEDLNVPIRKLTVPEYYFKWEKDAMKEFHRLRNISDSDLAKEREEKGAESVNHYTKELQLAKLRKEAYEAMLAQVEAWEPPSERHQGLKDFMTSQLTDSIKHDCSTDYLLSALAKVASELLEPLADYRRKVVEQAEKEYKRTLESRQEEEARVASQNEWVDIFLGSLPPAEEPAEA